MNHFFLEVTSIVVVAMEKFHDVEVNKRRKKPKCLSFTKEALILNHSAYALIHNVGVLKQMLRFNTSYFII